MQSTAKGQQEIVVPKYLKFSKIISWFMYFWVMFGVITLSLRVFLLAFSADTSAGFANFIMRTSGDYLEPFRGIFVGSDVGETGYLDVAAIFAIVVYLFIAWGFNALTDYIQNKIDTTQEEQRKAIKKAELNRKLALREKQYNKKPV